MCRASMAAFALAVLVASPAARARAEATEPLERRISVEFSKTPLLEAVFEVCRRAGLAAAVDRRFPDRAGLRRPVTFAAKDVRARDALETVLATADAACVVDAGVVLLTDTRSAACEGVSLRVYDCRDLTYSFSSFPGPSYYPGAHAVHSGDGHICHGGPIHIEAPLPCSMVSAGSLGEIIMCFVWPRSWSAELGTSIEERGSKLVVMQEEEVHAEIAALLRRMHARRGVFVEIDARSFLGRPGEIGSALGRTATPGFLTPDERRRVLERLASREALPAGSARTVCASGQRVYVLSGVQAPHVCDVDISGCVPDPVVTSTLDGIVVDVRPHVSNDRRFVSLDLKLQSYARSGPTRSCAVSTGPPTAVRTGGSGGEWDLSLQKDRDSAKVTLEPSSGSMVFVPAPVRVQRPEFDARSLRTSVRVPAGTTAYFRAPARGSGGRSPREILFFVRPAVLAPPEGQVPSAGERASGPAPDSRETARVFRAAPEFTRREEPLNHGECPELAKPVKAAFDETPLAEALQWIGGKVGIAVEVDRESMERLGSSPVTFRADEMPAGEVLGWLAALGGCVYEVAPRGPSGKDGPGVVLCSQERGMGRNVELRIYDVRDLTTSIEPYPGPDFAYEGGCAPGLTLYAEEDYDEITPASLAEMIMCRVRPDEWAAELGTSVEERGGRLVVMQTPRVHDEIAALLAEFRRTGMRMVSVSVRAARLPSGEVDGLHALAEPHGALGAAALAALATVEGKLGDGPSRLLGRAELTCFNTQRVHAVGGGTTQYVADYEISGDSYDPVVRSLTEGLTADVRPVLSDDGSTMLLELRLDYAERVSPGGCGEIEEFRPFGPAEASDPAPEIPTPGPVQLPRLAVAKVRTTVRTRSGATMMFAASDPANAALGEEIVFLVTATTVAF